MTKRDWIIIVAWFLVVCAILIGMASIAFGHHQGTTHRHHCGETWNWHRHAEWDLNTRRMHMSCGGLTVEEMEWVESRKGKTSPCLKLARTLGITTGYIPDVEHESTPAGPSMINTPAPHCEEDVESDCPDPPCEDVNPCPNPPCDEEPVKRKPVDTSGKPTDRSGPQEEDNSGCNAMVGVEICHTWRLNDYTLVGFPTEFKYLQDFYEHLKREVGETVDFEYMIDGEWESYRESSRFVDMTAHLGVRVNHDLPVSIVGRPVSGESVTLAEGTHVVGFPEVPSAYERFSDLLIDGVEFVRWYAPGVVWTIPDQDIDVEIERGMAVVIKTTKEVTFDLSGEVASAPMAQRESTLATSWAEMKRRD